MLILTILRANIEQKVYEAVLVPEELDISRHLNAHEFGEGSRVTYSLASVISHQGEDSTWGHYVSYLQQSHHDRKTWFKVNDHVVTGVRLSDFDDSRAAKMALGEFQRRATPYILFYERNFETDIITTGRAATNINEGDNRNERPSVWTGDIRAVTPECIDEN